MEWNDNFGGELPVHRLRRKSSRHKLKKGPNTRLFYLMLFESRAIWNVGFKLEASAALKGAGTH